MKLPSALLPMLFAAAAAAAIPTLARSIQSRASDSNNGNAAPTLPHRTVFQFNTTSTFLENLSVRPNGDLVLTMFYPTASLYLLQSPYSAHPAPKMSLLHTFPDTQGLIGIAQTQPDTYVVATYNWTTWPTPAPGSATLRLLSLSEDGQPSDIKTVARIPEAGLLNGLVAVPDSGVVLAADVRGGVVWRVDVATGNYDVALNVSETRAPEGGEALQDMLGVNGLKIRDGYLYFSNTGLATIFRVPLKPGTGHLVKDAAVEKVGTVPEGVMSLDDFVIDDEGTIWAMTGFDNQLVRMQPDGASAVVLGAPEAWTIAGDTAGQFGNTAWDREVLYITTDGAMANPINNRMEPGKVVAVDTRGARNRLRI